MTNALIHQNKAPLQRLVRFIGKVKMAVNSQSDAPTTGWTDDFSGPAFWDICHEKKSAMLLSGNSGEVIWKNLGVTPLVKANVRVLNIGVGLGLCTRDLFNRGCKVDALDISTVGLERVKDVTEQTWLAADVQQLPEGRYDLALSHLVAQHMLDEDLDRQLRSVIKALKPTGVFAIQIAYPLHDSTASRQRQWRLADAKAGSIYRTLSRFAEMVESAGGQVRNATTIGFFSEYDIGWYAVHIVKEGVRASK
jgi:SAM-dependent methyltransferase